MKRLVLALSLSLLVPIASAGAADDGASWLLRGKVALEAGDTRAALDLLGRAADDTSATASVRQEALLHLAALHRHAKEPSLAAAAFQRAGDLSKGDATLEKRLAEAVSGLRLTSTQWLRWGRGSRLVIRRRKDGTSLATIAWSTPGCSSESAPVGEPVALHLKDASLADVLRTFASLTGLELDLGDCTQAISITLDATDIPWDQAIADLLGSNGLDCTLDGNHLRVICPEAAAPEPAD